MTDETTAGWIPRNRSVVSQTNRFDDDTTECVRFGDPDYGYDKHEYAAQDERVRTEVGSDQYD